MSCFFFVFFAYPFLYLIILFSTAYNYCCSNNLQQPDPFIGRRWLRIAPVFANTGNRQQKTILFHYTGYGFVFDHSTGRNDFNAGFLCQIAHQSVHRLRCYAFAPPTFQKTAADADLVRVLPIAVNLCQPAEPSSINTPRIMDSLKHSSYSRRTTSCMSSYFCSNRNVGRYRYTPGLCASSDKPSASVSSIFLRTSLFVLIYGISEKSFFIFCFLPAAFAFTAILSPEQKTRKYAGS